MRAEIIVPMLMGCAMLWWIGRGMSTTARIVVAAITLAIVGAVIVFERGLS